MYVYMCVCIFVCVCMCGKMLRTIEYGIILYTWSHEMKFWLHLKPMKKFSLTSVEFYPWSFKILFSLQEKWVSFRGTILICKSSIKSGIDFENV